MIPKNFNLSTCLKNAWTEVENLYMQHLVPNENPCNFCLCRSISNQLPEGIHLTYDNVTGGKPNYKPDLTIWSSYDEASVLFFGEMKFWPEDIDYSERRGEKITADLIKLGNLLERDYIETLTLNPYNGNYDKNRIRIANTTQVGFFFVARHDSPFIKRGYIESGFGDDRLDRFHLATGRVFGRQDKRPHFDYQVLKPAD